MKDWLIANIFTIIATLFGSGSLFAYVTERKKRKIERKNLATDALKSMQDAYDRFTEDANERYNEIKLEKEELKKRLAKVTKQLNEERKKHDSLVGKERKRYYKLKQELDECMKN